MKYLTAIELSKKWGISNRMITIHCKNGRINGAIKKAELWLIPADAQKPIDKRRATSTAMSIDDNIAEAGVLAVQNKVEASRPDTTFYAESLYKRLGLTRETIRYYEKIGLIEPRRKIENLYREFNYENVFQFLTIDFYKKRGFNLPEIKKLMKRSNFADISISFEQKTTEIEQSMYNQQCILARLNETKEFFKCTCPIGEKFEIRDFPLYSVLKSLDYRTDILNYGDNILAKLDGEDLLSHLVRVTSFDDIGYRGTKICVVKKVSGKCHDGHGQFLESGKCMYTAGLVDDSFDEKIFFAAHKWMKDQELEYKGIAYFFNRFILSEKDNASLFSELWIPIK